MKTSLLVFIAFSSILPFAQPRSVRPDPPLSCSSCDEWNVPHDAFRIFGNTYYVGTAGLSAILITSAKGHILLDGALPQSAALIDKNIRAIGFQTEDVRLIVNSHAHYDHAGGIAALQRASGAIVAASAAGARALEQGYPTPDDPQYESGRTVRVPTVKNVKIVADGEVLRVGELTLTAHLTPGHTPGATTWSWRSCEDARCVDLVYADSLNPVSDTGFRFTGDGKRPSIVESFRDSVAKLEKLPCDILLAPHPSAIGMASKLARQKQDPKTNPFIETGACRAFAAVARKRLDARIAEEKKTAPANAQEYDHGAHGGDDVGRVAFPTSCDPGVQTDLERAVAMLHSFWYEKAEESFGAIAARDPECAIAHWGVAMSILKPLWQPPSSSEVQRASAAVNRAINAKRTSPREQAYVRAIATFYKDAATTPHAVRIAAYESAMAELHAAHPKDDEASAFYALALLGVAAASPTDSTFARQKKAAALLDQVAAAHPQHPGIAHYFIHAYDAPELAQLALPAARTYAKIAPGVPHALHMPSHIFTRLGLWEDSIASNIASAQAARTYAEKKGMQGVWDQELHALDYLMYGYLQGAQDRKAAQVLERLRAATRAEPPVIAAAYALAAAPARYALERHDWQAAAALTLPASNIAWDQYRWSESNIYYAAALGAARTGELAVAKRHLARLATMYADLRGKDKYAGLIETQRMAAAAWITQAEGRSDEAAALLRAAADLEESIEKHPVTPGMVLPARELFGDLLLVQGKPALALRAYEATLMHSPKRFNSIAGAMRAAERSGDDATARRYARELLDMGAKADSERPELAEAKRVAKN